MVLPMIAGLYRYRRAGVTSPIWITPDEIAKSLEVNPLYRELLIPLAGDRESAEVLESYGMKVYRTFDDAPPEVLRDTAHKMKHWMALWALREFGEFLWVDWDTVMIRPPDREFVEFCRSHATPKFIRIPNYWAGVNCGIYYAPRSWESAMVRSFGSEVEEPNDELLWRSVLPADFRERPEFWWGELIVHIQELDELDFIGANTYFAHVRELDWADEIRRVAEAKGRG